jgi:hypothetical protein
MFVFSQIRRVYFDENTIFLILLKCMHVKNTIVSEKWFHDRFQRNVGYTKQ